MSIPLTHWHLGQGLADFLASYALYSERLLGLSRDLAWLARRGLTFTGNGTLYRALYGSLLWLHCCIAVVPLHVTLQLRHLVISLSPQLTTTSLPLHYHATTGPPDCRCEAGVRSASFMSAISCTGYCAQPPDNVEVIYYILCFCRRTLMFFYDRREFLWFPTKKTENRLPQVTFQRAYNDPSKPSCRYNCSKSLRFLAPGRSWQSRISVPRIQYIDKP